MHSAENFLSTGRKRTAEVQMFATGVAQREALIGSLQAQLAQAKLQAQVAQQAQAEREQVLSLS